MSTIINHGSTFSNPSSTSLDTRSIVSFQTLNHLRFFAVVSSSSCTSLPSLFGPSPAGRAFDKDDREGNGRRSEMAVWRSRDARLSSCARDWTVGSESGEGSLSAARRASWVERRLEERGRRGVRSDEGEEEEELAFERRASESDWEGNGVGEVRFCLRMCVCRRIGSLISGRSYV
jgi:hypothetical protein